MITEAELQAAAVEIQDFIKEQRTIGLGDIVSHNWTGGYGDGTVCQVHKDGSVDVFRPYTHTVDFSCSGRREGSLSLMCYVGVETSKDVDPKHLKLIRKNSTPIR